MTALAKPLSIRSHPTNLYNGDRMTQKEFHAAYLKAPPGFKAELIGGTVYVASPLSWPHSQVHGTLAMLFGMYCAATGGAEFGDNATVVLAEDCEPQPDLVLRIATALGGRSEITRKNFVKGPPELIAEISYSSHAIDVHGKLNDYRSYGVLEYLIVNLKERSIDWFDLSRDIELSPDADGIHRIRTFPGLWIHGPSLIERNVVLLTKALQQGLASPEHAQFVKKLAARARGKKG